MPDLSKLNPEAQTEEWWNALPIAKRRELVAKEHATQGKR
jgi:hypothetical protein